MTKEKQIWYSFPDNKYNDDALQTAFQGGYNTFFLPVQNLEWLDRVKLPKQMSVAVLLDKPSDLQLVDKHPVASVKTEHLIYKDIEHIDKSPKKDKRSKGLFINVKDHDTLLKTVEVSQKLDNVIIEFKDPTNIPLELVLAKTQALPTRVIKRVTEADDGDVSLMTMESGSDGILLASHNLDSIMTLDKSFQKATKVKFGLKPAKVTAIKHAGMGNRVCIDTTSELGQDEAMLLGSTSQGGLMVCSETHFLPYMDLRPFRVNAGGLHMYIWGPDNFCAYLSDLKAGDKVFAINSKNEARVVTVGRVKIERRPLLLIEAEIEGKKINTFIQDDWHVRVMGSKGEIRPSAEVEVGDYLLGFLDTPGRHVGFTINETIKEV